MDLYHVLRVSLYAMVASGAFALFLAEPGHGPFYLVAVAALAALARVTVDRGRPRPRPALIYVLALAFLVSFLLPLRDEHEWHRQTLFALAHFLCIFQALLFFVPYGGGVLLTTGVATLAIVVVSGVMDSGATLLLRMACCVAATYWTLLLHTLWRGRASFLGQEWVATANRASNGDAARPDVLSDRALKQGLALTASLTAACLVLGLFLFVAAPRVNETLSGWIEAVLDKRQPAPQAKSPFPIGRSPDGGTAATGIGETVTLTGLGPIHRNQAPALAVTFSRLTGDVTDGDGRILLRGLAFSTFHGGRWHAATDAAPQDARRALNDPSAPGVKYRGEEIRQIVEEGEALHSRAFFAAGPVSRVEQPQVTVDSEGVVRVPPDVVSAGRYVVWSYPPMQAKRLPEDAVAEHPDRAKYVLQDGLRPDRQQDVRDRAHAITRGCATPLEKIRAIVAFLRDSKHCAYLLRLDELKHDGDPVAEFLLSKDPNARRGHCGYFATAFVVLCRLNGIPARLATGFAVPAPLSADSGRRVVFRNSDAHAWGEVFFKDLGWVAFDPTPPAPPLLPEPRVAAVPAPAGGTPGPAVGGTLSPAGVQRLWDWMMHYNRQEQQALYERVSTVVNTSLGGAGDVVGGRSAAGWIGALLAWVGTGCLIVWAMQLFLKHGRRRGAKLSAGAARAQAALAFYNDLLLVLSRRGYVRRPSQTPREFAERVVRFGGKSFEPVLVVTQVFESVRYGGADITQDDFNRLQEALDGLREVTFLPA